MGADALPHFGFIIASKSPIVKSGRKLFALFFPRGLHLGEKFDMMEYRG
jgi:hypothetical protein